MGAPNPTAAQLGDTIRELREERRLTLEDLAGLASIHTTTLSKIERGVTNPQWESVRAVADALAVDSSLLLRLAELLSRANQKPTT